MRPDELFKRDNALATSPTDNDKDGAVQFIEAAGKYFAQISAPLATGCALLLAQLQGKDLTTLEVGPGDPLTQAVRALGVTPEDGDVQRVHHGILDAAFPGPRIEATAEYRAAAKSFREGTLAAASEAKVGFAKP